MTKRPVRIACPRCGSVSVFKHCTSSTCDLIRCTACHGYGPVDGRLWARMFEGKP